MGGFPFMSPPPLLYNVLDIKDKENEEGGGKRRERT
jgi:hypothetical protein